MRWTPHNGPHNWIAHRGLLSWGIQIRSFGVHKTYVCETNFHFINWPLPEFPLSCIHWNGQLTMDPISEWHQGVILPWHVLIGSLAFHETYFCKMIFHLINLPHAASPFLCIQLNGHPTKEPKMKRHITLGLGQLNSSICTLLNLYLRSIFVESIGQNVYSNTICDLLIK